MSGFDDDDLTQPLEGAARRRRPRARRARRWAGTNGSRATASTASGAAGRSGRSRSACSRVPWWAWLTLFVALFALDAGRRNRRVLAARRLRHRPLHDARPRPQRRRRLGRAPRSRLHRVLRLRRLHLRDPALSDQFDLHWPTLLVIAIALAGGSVARDPRRPAVEAAQWRLPRDRDALRLPDLHQHPDQRRQHLRHRPDGRRQRHPQGRPAELLRARDPGEQGGGVFNVAYLYVALGVFTVLFVALRFVDRSRTGRAWRSMREDSLAAQLMGMPVPWLKLMAFSFGAAIAALTGTLFVALERLGVPRQLRSHAADHDLRDDDPRRPRQPGRRGARRHPDQRPARVAARAVQLALHLLRRAPARPRRGVPALGPPRRRRGRCRSCSASSSGSSSTGSTRAGPARRPRTAAGSAISIASWVVEPSAVTPVGEIGHVHRA